MDVAPCDSRAPVCVTALATSSCQPPFTVLIIYAAVTLLLGRNLCSWILPGPHSSGSFNSGINRLTLQVTPRNPFRHTLGFLKHVSSACASSGHFFTLSPHLELLCSPGLPGVTATPGCCLLLCHSARGAGAVSAAARSRPLCEPGKLCICPLVVTIQPSLGWI